MRTRLWIAAHAMVVLLPVAGAVARLPDTTLYGVEPPVDFPRLTLADWRAEKTQPILQSWFERRIGFRGVLVRTDNALQTSVLKETQTGSFVVIGSDSTYFSIDDVRFMGTQRRDMPGVLSRVDHLTTQLGSVHRKLAERGKHLVVTIAPSKTVIYPEAIPARWRTGAPVSSEEVHTALREGLTKEGVPFGDADAIIRARPADRELLFPRTARHWTLLGACLALRDALHDGPVTPSCEYDMLPVHRAHDWAFDLTRLQNVWGTDIGREDMPVVRPQTPPATRPRALFVGTSFLWILATVLGPLSDDRPYALFYNRTFFDVSTGQRVESVDPSSPAWSTYVLERDLYIIDILETFADHAETPAFLDELERRLDDEKRR